VEARLIQTALEAAGIEYIAADELKVQGVRLIAPPREARERGNSSNSRLWVAADAVGFVRRTTDCFFRSDVGITRHRGRRILVYLNPLACFAPTLVGEEATDRSHQVHGSSFRFRGDRLRALVRSLERVNHRQPNLLTWRRRACPCPHRVSCGSAQPDQQCIPARALSERECGYRWSHPAWGEIDEEGWRLPAPNAPVRFGPYRSLDQEPR